MHRKPPVQPHSRALILMVALACVGLASAVAHKRVRRLEIEGARPQPVELAVNISTQVMSFQVGDEIELENPLEPKHTIMMNVPPQKPPAPIIHSTPARDVELARKEYQGAAPVVTNAPVVLGPPQEIVSE